MKASTQRELDRLQPYLLHEDPSKQLLTDEDRLRILGADNLEQSHLDSCFRKLARLVHPDKQYGATPAQIEDCKRAFNLLENARDGYNKKKLSVLLGTSPEDIQYAFTLAMALNCAVMAQRRTEEIRIRDRDGLLDSRRRHLHVSETPEEVDHLISWAQENEEVREFLSIYFATRSPWTSGLEDLWTKELYEFRKERDEDEVEIVGTRTVEERNTEGFANAQVLDDDDDDDANDDGAEMHVVKTELQEEGPPPPILLLPLLLPLFPLLFLLPPILLPRSPRNAFLPLLPLLFLLLPSALPKVLKTRSSSSSSPPPVPPPSKRPSKKSSKRVPPDGNNDGTRKRVRRDTTPETTQTPAEFLDKDKGVVLTFINASINSKLGVTAQLVAKFPPSGLINDIFGRSNRCRCTWKNVDGLKKYVYASPNKAGQALKAHIGEEVLEIGMPASLSIDGHTCENRRDPIPDSVIVTAESWDSDRRRDPIPDSVIVTAESLGSSG